MKMLSLKKNSYDYLSTFLRQGASVIIGSVQVLLLAKFLGPELNGQFGQYLVFIAFVAVVLSLGLGNALISAVKNSKLAAINIQQATGFLFFIYPILLLFGSIITFLITTDIFTVGLFICALFVAFFNNTQCLLMSEERFKAYNKLALINQLVTITLYIGLITFSFAENAELFVLAYLLSQLVTLAFSLCYALENKGVIAYVSFTNCRTVFSVIKRFSLSSLVTSLFFMLNAKFIFIYASGSLTATEIGFFFLAMSVMEKVNTVIYSISSVAYPKMSSMGQAKVAYIKKLSLISFAISILLGLLSILVVKLLPLVIGENYDIYDIYLYFCASIPFIALVKLSHSIIYSYAKHQMVLTLTFINLVLTLLIPLFNVSSLESMSLYFLMVNILTALLSICFCYYLLKARV